MSVKLHLDTYEQLVDIREFQIRQFIGNVCFVLFNSALVHCNNKTPIYTLSVVKLTGVMVYSIYDLCIQATNDAVTCIFGCL